MPNKLNTKSKDFFTYVSILFIILLLLAGAINSILNTKRAEEKKAEQKRIEEELIKEKNEYISDYISSESNKIFFDIDVYHDIAENLNTFNTDTNKILNNIIRIGDQVNDLEVSLEKEKLERKILNYTVISKLSINYFITPVIARLNSGSDAYFKIPPRYPEGAANFLTIEYYIVRPLVNEQGKLSLVELEVLPRFARTNQEVQSLRKWLKETKDSNAKKIEQISGEINNYRSEYDDLIYKMHTYVGDLCRTKYNSMRINDSFEKRKGELSKRMFKEISKIYEDLTQNDFISIFDSTLNKLAQTDLNSVLARTDSLIDYIYSDELNLPIEWIPYSDLERSEKISILKNELESINSLQLKSLSYTDFDESSLHIYTHGLNEDSLLYRREYFTSSLHKDAGAPDFQLIEDSTWNMVSTGNYATPSAGIKSDGTLWTWGYYSNGQDESLGELQEEYPIQVGEEKWDNVSACWNATFAVKKDKTLWGWGNIYNPFIQVITDSQSAYPSASYDKPVKLNFDRWESIHCDAITLAIKEDGSLWFWTYSKNFSLELLSDEKWSSIGITSDVIRDRFIYGVKDDGSLWLWNDVRPNSPSKGIDELSKPKKISDDQWDFILDGGYFMLGKKTDDSVHAWGNNICYSYGLNTENPVFSPIEVGYVDEGRLVVTMSN